MIRTVCLECKIVDAVHHLPGNQGCYMGEDAFKHVEVVFDLIWRFWCFCWAFDSQTTRNTSKSCDMLAPICISNHIIIYRIPYTVYLLSCLYLIYLQSQHNVLIHAVFFSHIDKITFKHSNFSAGGCPDQISQEEVSAISPEHGRVTNVPLTSCMMRMLSWSPLGKQCPWDLHVYTAWIIPKHINGLYPLAH